MQTIISKPWSQDFFSSISFTSLIYKVTEKSLKILFHAFVSLTDLLSFYLFFFLISFCLPTSSPISTPYAGSTLLLQCTGTSKNYNRASEVTLKCIFNVGKCALILKSELGNPSSGNRRSLRVRPRWGLKHMFQSPTLTAMRNIAKHVRNKIHSMVFVLNDFPFCVVNSY